jgi:hypothetical protein
MCNWNEVFFLRETSAVSWMEGVWQLPHGVGLHCVKQPTLTQTVKEVYIFLTFLCHNKYDYEIWTAFLNMTIILTIVPCFVLFLNILFERTKDSGLCRKLWSCLLSLLFFLLTVYLLWHELLKASLNEPYVKKNTDLSEALAASFSL